MQDDNVTLTGRLPGVGEAEVGQKRGDAPLASCDARLAN